MTNEDINELVKLNKMLESGKPMTTENIKRRRELRQKYNDERSTREQDERVTNHRRRREEEEARKMQQLDDAIDFGTSICNSMPDIDFATDNNMPASDPSQPDLGGSSDGFGGGGGGDSW